MDTKYKYLSSYSVKTIGVILNIKVQSFTKFKILLNLIIYWYLNSIKNRVLFLCFRNQPTIDNSSLETVYRIQGH